MRGKYTRLGDYIRISESSIDNYCVIENKVTIDRSAVLDGARIASYTHITDSILGRKTFTESSHEHPTYIENNSVIGNTSQIKEGCRLIRTKVNLGIVIPKGVTYIDKTLSTYQDVVQLSL